VAARTGRRQPLATLEPVEVLRGKHKDSVLFGPQPGVRHDNVVAYEFALPERFEP